MVTLRYNKGLAIKLFIFVPQTALICSIRISEKITTISVYRINRLVVYNIVIVCLRPGMIRIFIRLVLSSKAYTISTRARN